MPTIDSSSPCNSTRWPLPSASRSGWGTRIPYLPS
jgi:hypothetical protein